MKQQLLERERASVQPVEIMYKDLLRNNRERRKTIHKRGMMSYKIELSGLLEEIGRLTSKEGYLFAGSPKFLGLFGRDSLIASWELLDIDPSIAKNTLVALAKIQGQKLTEETREQPGKIAHEYYPKETTSKEWFDEYKAPVGWLQLGRAEYLAVDTTPLFIIMLEKYYSKTNDNQTLRELWPNAKRAFEWIVNYGMEDNFVRYMPKQEKLKSQSWKDGIGPLMDDVNGPVAVVEVQGYVYKALTDMIKLAGIMNDSSMVDKFQMLRDNLRKNFEKDFWMDDEKYYAMALDGNNYKVNSVSSNPGQLLFTGILPKDRADAVVERLFADDMFTPYGIRTQSSNDSNFDPLEYQLGSIWPHDNWIIAQGLKDLGYKNEYNKVGEALMRAAKELGTIPEYYDVSEEGRLIKIKDMKIEPCDPQAWSLGALINLMVGK